ncbi:MAG: hypothetical protein U0451_02070 [Candidatus Saccharimonadales bacterium]
MIMRLRASDSKEARDTGRKILEQARKVIPTFLERADKPDRGGATTAYFAQTRKKLKEIADTNLLETHSSDLNPVTLRTVWPRNELDLVPYMALSSTAIYRCQRSKNRLIAGQSCKNKRYLTHT